MAKIRIEAWFLKQVAADPKRYSNVAETWYEDILFDEALQCKNFAKLNDLSDKEIVMLKKQGYIVEGKTVYWK